MFIRNIHVSLCSINLYLENGPGKKCIWKRIWQIHQIRRIKYKYKYKYMVWNLIKYKYKYKYAVFVFVFVFANTNTYLTPALAYASEATMKKVGKYITWCWNSLIKATITKILIQIPLMCVLSGLLDYKSALLKTMVRQWPGDRPLPEPVMFICITNPQW